MLIALAWLLQNLVLLAVPASAVTKSHLHATNSKECSISRVSQATKRWFQY